MIYFREEFLGASSECNFRAERSFQFIPRAPKSESVARLDFSPKPAHHLAPPTAVFCWLAVRPVAAVEFRVPPLGD